MREELKKISGKRLRFSGEFERYGSKKSWKGFPEMTVLLKDVRDESGKVVTDHLWFKLTKGFLKLGELVEGERIIFEARAKPYVKGYVSRREDIDERTVDYRLSHPTKFLRVDISGQIKLL